MRYSLPVKFLAIFLCALSLLAALVGGLGVVQLVDKGLYEKSLDALQAERTRSILSSVARETAGRYAASALSNCSQDFIDRYFGSEYQLRLPDDTLWFYTLKDQQGEVLHSSYKGWRLQQS